MTEKQLGKNIRACRKWRGASRDEIAKSARVSRAAMWMIETGRRNTTIKTFLRIAKAMDVHPAALLTGGW